LHSEKNANALPPAGEEQITPPDGKLRALIAGAPLEVRARFFA
jgi:hypothetical protein